MLISSNLKRGNRFFLQVWDGVLFSQTLRNGSVITLIIKIGSLQLVNTQNGDKCPFVKTYKNNMWKAFNNYQT